MCPITLILILVATGVGLYFALNWWFSKPRSLDFIDELASNRREEKKQKADDEFSDLFKK